LQQLGGGLKIAYLSTLQSRGWAYAWYALLSKRRDQANSAKGGEKYQQAFYVFEELAQAPATSSIQSLISQAVAEVHLGRLDEAEAALKQAIAKDPKNAEAISNSIVLNVIQGKDTAQLKRFVVLLSCLAT
jgi:Flp pilus assembly protein TadD